MIPPKTTEAPVKQIITESKGETEPYIQSTSEANCKKEPKSRNQSVELQLKNAE